MKMTEKTDNYIILNNLH